MGILTIFFLIGIFALVLLVFLTVRKNAFIGESVSFKNIFFGFLMLAILVCGELAYLCFSILDRSDLRIANRISDFMRYDNILINVIQISFIALLVLANWGYFYRLRLTKWTFIIALGFFSSFILLDYIFIAETFFHFKKQNDLWKGEFSITALAGLLMCFVAALFVVANYWLNGLLMKRAEMKHRIDAK
jgi:hypothetical protein